jgi:riboflavin biosynthesis pyrimidine reductase
MNTPPTFPGCAPTWSRASTALRRARTGAEYAAHRRALGQRPTPAIAVVSGRLDLDPEGSLFTGREEPTIALTAETSPPKRRVVLDERADVVVVGKDRVDLSRAVDALVKRGYTRVLCER